MRLRESFWAFLQGEAAPAEPIVVERIRLAMLLALDSPGMREQLALEMCIRFAIHIEELWYLRADLQQALLQDCSEPQTLQVMQNINQLFETKRPRPGRFGFGPRV